MKRVMGLVLAFLAVPAGAFAADARQQFTLEQIGTSFVSSPDGLSTTTTTWSMKSGQPESSEAKAVGNLNGTDATILTPSPGGQWLKGVYVALGSPSQVRVSLLSGGPDEFLPVSLRGLDPSIISEVAIYPAGIRVNFRSGITLEKIREAVAKSTGLRLAQQEE